MSRSEAEARSRDRRAQSEVLGFALLLGVTVLSASAVVVVGGDLVDTSQQRVAFDGAELAMTELDSRVGLVGLGGAESKRVSLPASSRGSTSVDADAGSLRVTITNRTTGEAVVNESITLGAVIYRQEGRSVAYQGGGVWRVADGGEARMVSPPEFHYRLKAGGEPTLTLPVVTVSGGGTGDTFTATDGGTEVLFPRRDDRTLSNPLESGRVEITVESDYYRAWGSYLETRTSGDVRYDHDRRTVTLTLVSPTEPRTIGDAITSGSRSVVVSGNTDVDGYNSSAAPYAPGDPCPDGPGATVYVVRDLEVRGDSTVCGDMYVDGDLHVGGGMTIRGDLVVDGDLSFGGGAGTVDADRIVTTGTLDLAGGVTLASDAVVGGSVSEAGGVTVTSNVSVGGDYYAGSGNFAGRAHVAGDFVPANGDVSGEIRTAGEYDDEGVHPNDGSATISEGVSPPDLRALRLARDLDPPNLAPVDNEIRSTLDEVANDSDADPSLTDVESGDCWDGCSLSAGRYHLDRVDVGGTLEVNTTDGPVTLAVENDFGIDGGGRIDVTGDERVRIYVGGDVSIGGELLTGSGRGDQVVIYGGSDSTYTVSSATAYGVLYAPGNRDISLSGGSELFGAAVGTVSDVSGGSAIHYDHALSDEAAIEQNPERYPYLTYVHVSVNRVNVTVTGDR